MSDLLSIGASGVRAYQSALTTTSDNIANAGTTGFVRRTTNLSEVAGAGLASGSGGLGVIANGVVRSADAFRSAQVRSAGADVARSETGIVWLDRIETSLAGQKLDERLTSFFNAATALAADPSAIAPRTAMMENARGVAQAFTGTINALDTAAVELDATASDAATRIGELGAGLAKVNESLARVSPGTAGQAQLLDQRDRLLEEMSGLVDTDVQIDAVGRASVRGGGAGGPVLVHGDKAATVAFTRNEEGAVAFVTRRDGVEAILSANGGSIAGIGEGATRIADARASLVALAGEFAVGVNAVQANGQDLNGAPGTAMFAVDAAGTVTVSMTDPQGIAAARTGGGPRDNGNLAELASLRGTARFESRTVALSAANGSALAARRTVVEAQTAIRDSAVAARDSASGVNLDQEAIDLMRFQQAYQASSRVIQVARETLDTLFAIR